MADLRVAKWNRRYRLGGDARSDRARIDRVLSAAVDDSLLSAAIERAGIPSTEELCIRSVASFVRLDRSEPDSRIAVAWSVALADAIARRVREGGPDVVRFASRHQALANMACCVARGELDRSWAWRQLGLWHTADFVPSAASHGEVIDALVREARAAPAVLAVVARAGLLRSLSLNVPAERWTTLARAALIAFDSDRSLLRALAIDGDSGHDVSSPADAGHIIARVTHRSAILAAVVKDRRADMTTARAFVALAILECEPGLVCSSVTEIVVRELSAFVAANAERQATDARIAKRATAARSASEVGAPRKPEIEPSAMDNGVVGDDRPRYTTAFGGLVFLLHAVRALDLPTVVSVDPVLASRSLRWTLHGLALILAPLDATDAAALAFCGLAPNMQPPSQGELPTTDAERSTLGGLADAIRAWIREYGVALPDENDDSLLRGVTSRRAEVVADPAWIELRFALGDATTEVRRAGLDLDLGWVPWLGVVVRFVYE